MLKVTINQEECISCGACWSDCPEFFEESEEGTSQIVEQYRVDGDPTRGEAPDNLEDCVRTAAEGCAVEAIQIE